ncbi:MAG: alpha-L-fucosidase [Bacteroidota bacterium]|nr:alpha-L-fucosidase [Bacteroidota bacterium]
MLHTPMKGQIPLPSPCSPVPSKRQVEWQKWECYAFVHFGINTFTDKEWGYGDESPALFNPTDFNADEAVRLFHEAGMTAVILTAKHHDGFCLWQTAFTDHSVKKSPWRGGKGDVVGEFAEACKRNGMKFGVYLSPWDRNRSDYGTPEYLNYYRNQLTELLTNYGEIAEVWFDGANGGDGYYGGAREKRTIDRSTYYGWDTTWNLVRRLQPNAVIFSDVGPDIRWIGNEKGIAGETCWSMYSPVGEHGTPPAPGNTVYSQAIEGSRDGKAWLPAECDVSIRPGWFYHQKEDSLVKSGQQLLNLYLQTVGRNASLLLNVPLDRRGRVAQSDSIALMKFKHLRDRLFATDFARGASVNSSNTRGNDVQYSAENVVDGDPDTYWATDDSVTNASLILRLSKKATFDCLLLQEYILLGQRVESFSVEWLDGNRWRELASGTTIGHKRLLRFSPVTTDEVRLVIHRSRCAPLISAFSLYKFPPLEK